MILLVHTSTQLVILQVRTNTYGVGPLYLTMGSPEDLSLYYRESIC